MLHRLNEDTLFYHILNFDSATFLMFLRKQLENRENFVNLDTIFILIFSCILIWGSELLEFSTDVLRRLCSISHQILMWVPHFPIFFRERNLEIEITFSSWHDFCHIVGPLFPHVSPKLLEFCIGLLECFGRGSKI